MKSLRNYLYRRPISSTLILILIEYLLVRVKFGAGASDLALTILKEAILAAIALFFIYLVTGKEEVVFSSKGIGYAFRKGWYIFVIAVLTGISAWAAVLMGNNHLTNNVILVFLGCVIYATLIGLFEEGLFRGLFLNALLSRYGKTYNGILKAMIISSLLFGFLHVASDVISGLSNPGAFTLELFGQVLGKTIQAGMVGFILAAIYLKNHNLWSVAILHGLNDFIMFLPNYLFNTVHIGEYVQSSYGYITILIYVFISILSIPLVVVGYRLSKKVSVPQMGFFRACWFPLNIKK